MEVFSQEVQKYLYKVEQKHGKLKFLSSRATAETSSVIDEITESFAKVFKAHNMFPDANNNNNNNDSLITDSCDIKGNVAQGYMWLLLNTDFKLQSFLMEDVQYGHMVGQWPVLSPYLFMQIMWHFEYERILTMSFPHIPLDLCMEILEITITCIHELELKRARNLIIRLLGNVYQKCLQLNMQVSQHNLEERASQLIVHFQTLLSLLTDDRITRFSELSDEAKYHEHGILLKMLLSHIKKWVCTAEGTTGERDITTRFTLAYSSNYSSLTDREVRDVTIRLEEELIALLLKEFQKVNTFEYIHWAEVDNTGNGMISLQRAIAVECQDFMGLEKRFSLLRHDELQECLLLYAGKSLTLRELCYYIVNDKPERLTELMERYTEWDEDILSFLRENLHFLTKENSKAILEYLRHLYVHRKNFSAVEFRKLYYSALKLALSIDVSVLYDVILKYVDARVHEDNPFAELYNYEKFANFMGLNEHMPETLRTRIFLLAMLFNVKATLLTLMKFVIGVPSRHPHIVFTVHNLEVLLPFLRIKLNRQCNMLIYCLKNICLTSDKSWNTKNFLEFMKFALDKQLATTDQLVDSIYIPYLIGGPLIYSNLTSILLCIRNMLKEAPNSQETNYSLLVITLLKKASFIRRCTINLSATTADELISSIKTVLFEIPVLDEHQKQEVIDAVDTSVEPIDLATQAFMTSSLKGVIGIIEDYERRCFVIHTQLRTSARGIAGRRELACSIKLDRRALIRHMILQASKNEYTPFMYEMAVINWFYFGWSSERNGFENLMAITTEALKLIVVYNDVFPKDKFVHLMMGLVNFSKLIALHTNDQKYTVDVLLMNLSALRDVHAFMPSNEQFGFILTRIQDNLAQLACEEDCFKVIAGWIMSYIYNFHNLTDPIKDVPVGPDIQNLFITYSFVSACIKISCVQTDSYVDKVLNSICDLLSAEL